MGLGRDHLGTVAPNMTKSQTWLTLGAGGGVHTSTYEVLYYSTPKPTKISNPPEPRDLRISLYKIQGTNKHVK